MHNGVDDRESQPAKHDVCNDVDDSREERASQTKHDVCNDVDDSVGKREPAS